MEILVINGGKPLNGSITIGGMKNAALPIIFASILTEDTCTLENLPNVSDITRSLEILQAMGARITYNKDGSVSATSKKNLYSAEQWEQMMDSLSGVVEDIANRMKMGDIEAIPRKKKNASPCEHCAYKAVCRNHS